MSNPDTGTQLIFTENPGAIPADYTLPPKLNLKVSSVLARIDGSGAAAAFLPCLSIYSQDGHLMARRKAGQQFAAGDTGVVTWASFLGDDVAPVTASNFRVWWAGALADDKTGGVHNIPSAVDTQLIGNQQSGPSPLNAAFPITFDNTVGAFNVVRVSVNPAPPAGQNANAYLFRLSLLWPAVPADYRYIRLGFSTAGAGEVSLQGVPVLTSRTPKNETTRSQYQELLALVPPFVFAQADAVDVKPFAYQESGANQFPAWQLEAYSVQT